MPYGSPKQLAYFKAQAEKFKLFPPCNEGGDIFDFEGLKAKHAARIKRAAGGLRAIKVRRKIQKYLRGQNVRARAAGFKNHAEREASGWTPSSGFEKMINAKRKKGRVAPADKGSMFGKGYKEENPFRTDEHRRAQAFF